MSVMEIAMPGSGLVNRTRKFNGKPMGLEANCPPKRGELVRLLGEELRAIKVALDRSRIVSGRHGEVRKTIDIFDFEVDRASFMA
jgi:hypothetical protein